MIAARCLAVAAVLLATAARAEPLTSATAYLSDDLKAQQFDEARNPGMLWVGEGERLWEAPAGASGRPCAACHGAPGSMRGVAARYPAVDAGSGELLNLEGRINRCRTRHQGAEALAYESDALLGLTAFVARQSLGMPVAVLTDGAAASFHRAGEAFFRRRQGQMNLSCAHCHDDNAGRSLRGDTISHGLGNGYPAYRLEWQSVGSLHRRLRSCAYGVRAVQPAPGSPEHLALELYLAGRAAGVAVETPAIRK